MGQFLAENVLKDAKKKSLHLLSGLLVRRVLGGSPAPPLPCDVRLQLDCKPAPPLSHCLASSTAVSHPSLAVPLLRVKAQQKTPNKIVLGEGSTVFLSETITHSLTSWRMARQTHCCG